MAKYTELPFDASAVAQALNDRGIAVEPQNPNLAAIAGSLGLTQRVRSVEVKKSEKSGKMGLCISGAAMGRDAWFPITDLDAARKEAQELIDGLTHFVKTLE